MKTLKPVDVSDFYIRQVASGMAQYFWGYIFGPIFEILAENTVDNSKNDLIKAIKSGRVWYQNGAFRTKGRFTNSISKTLEEMGARYSRGAYYIQRAKISTELLSIINLSRVATIQKANKISEFLGGLLPILETLTVRDFIEISVERMYKKLELDIVKSAQEYKLPVIDLGIVVPDVNISRKRRKEIETYWKERDKQAGKLREQIRKAKTKEEKNIYRNKLVEFQAKTHDEAPSLDIGIEEYELNKVSKEIAEDYVYNMNFWIKKWETKNIVEMRKKIADMVQEGAQSKTIEEYVLTVPKLQKLFEGEWDKAKKKAHFLAENESRLAASVIQATQYQKMGCTQFEWGRSTSKEKRELHKSYYGQVFDFDNPPIIDEKLGVRGLPRQIWNCKCQMLCVPPSRVQVIKKTEEVRNAKRNIFKQIKNSMQRSNSNWRYGRYGEG